MSDADCTPGREPRSVAASFLAYRKLDTFCYLTVQTAPCYVQRFDTIPACDRWTDGRTNGRNCCS